MYEYGMLYPQTVWHGWWQINHFDPLGRFICHFCLSKCLFVLSQCFDCLLLKNTILRDKYCVKGNSFSEEASSPREKVDSCPKEQLLPADQGVRAFKRENQGCTMKCAGLCVGPSTLRSDSHLEIGHAVVWSASSWLFQYSYSSVPRSVCSHFLESSSQNCVR